MRGLSPSWRFLCIPDSVTVWSIHYFPTSLISCFDAHARSLGRAKFTDNFEKPISWAPSSIYSASCTLPSAFQFPWTSYRDPPASRLGFYFPPSVRELHPLLEPRDRKTERDKKIRTSSLHLGITASRGSFTLSYFEAPAGLSHHHFCCCPH